MTSINPSEKRSSSTHQTVRIIEARDGKLTVEDIEDAGAEQVAGALKIMAEQGFPQEILDNAQAAIDDFLLRQAQQAEDAKRPYKAA